jgi:predicted transcriptional regulator of viral defense system
MDYDTLLSLVGDDPLFESSLLMAGDVDPRLIRLQLTRWVNSGRILQLRRGLYAIAPPYQKVKPHPFLVANHLQRASYVSLQSALAFHGLIPEVMAMTTSVTAGRPERLDTPLGVYDFRHVKPGLLSGYRMLDLGGQSARVALPEKALLDLVYLQPGGKSKDFLRGLRLQDLDLIDTTLLLELAESFDSPRMQQAAMHLVELVRSETDSYEEL